MTEDPLVGAADIARQRGISRARVHQIIKARPDFPEPRGEVGGQRIWLRSHVDAWWNATFPNGEDG